MADKLTPEHRSWNMSRVRSKDTKIESIVRSTLHRMGFRFRKNVRSLPGTPDIVLRRYNSVIFVNGCFWHQHKNCSFSHMPRSNKKFWKDKLTKNVARDLKNKNALLSQGWKILYVWQCEIGNNDRLVSVLKRFLLDSSK